MTKNLYVVNINKQLSNTIDKNKFCHIKSSKQLLDAYCGLSLRHLPTSNLRSCFREQESKIFQAKYTWLKLKDPNTK